MEARKEEGEAEEERGRTAVRVELAALVAPRDVELQIELVSAF